ncbi:hydroxymethylpyrimidine/phosphomethylpyrimidine kinase [Chitinophaga filiformis]|uniref:hydroxymethylpyrimidine/phosphomethylpyrimidine kinase n=1 Tax=Chitinophaga filiformis TaxID=104663 RepID=UPI001F41659D|nr:hydroxymethylpyrimidine/phosphomethylpyrimidine kinase [Chitinophaga filiformis]MCF6401768.1 hydroxymethylpyrimidine/phosphomethylpyrimidine kinase [Chitinophaga filiformis]
MEDRRPYVISLAGLDPSAGAGLLADIKTFEALGVYGLGVCTAITVQTDSRFLSVEWQSAGQIIAQATPLMETYPVAYCKIGIVRDAATILEVIEAIKAIQPDVRFILDPVLKASAGYTFHDTTQLSVWKQVLQQVYLLTPNYQEAQLLSGEEDGHAAASALAAYSAVLLKGGHRQDRQGVDSLYIGRTDIIDIPASIETVFPKHGSGCVLSAAITAQLAAGSSLPVACIKAKLYTEKFLASHSSLLGYHIT